MDGGTGSGAHPDDDGSQPVRAVTPPDLTVAAFDALGAEYERAFAGLAPLDAALDRLTATVPPGARVLDVGSGTGRPVAERLVAAGHRVTGIDVSPRMVEIAREQVPGAAFEVADVRSWTTGPRSWDAVCAFFSLLTMPRPELDATIGRLAAWLVPGGRLALATVPLDVDGYEGRFLGQPVRVFSYSAEVVLERLRETGLEIERHELTTFRPDHPDAFDEEHLFVDARRPVGSER